MQISGHHSCKTKILNFVKKSFSPSSLGSKDWYEVTKSHQNYVEILILLWFPLHASKPFRSPQFKQNKVSTSFETSGREWSALSTKIAPNNTKDSITRRGNIYEQCTFHMETIRLICHVNQINGFYIMKPLALNELQRVVKKFSLIF